MQMYSVETTEYMALSYSKGCKTVKHDKELYGTEMNITQLYDSEL